MLSEKALRSTRPAMPDTLPYQVTCAKCGLIVTLYAPVEKADGSREYTCLECLLELRRTGWPPSYETKITMPQECKCGDCGCQRIE